MYKNFFSIAFLIIFLVSCKEKITIDNALNEKVTVEINNKKYDLDSNTSLDLNLKKGKQKVISYKTNGDTLLNTNVDIENTGILNATNTTYVIWTDIYCKEEDYEKYKNNLNLKDSVKLDGLEFIDVDFQLKNEAFISTNWQYGLNVDMPDTLNLKDDEAFRIVSKIYRPQQIKEEFNYVGDLDLNNLTEDEINKILESR